MAAPKRRYTSLSMTRMELVSTPTSDIEVPCYIRSFEYEKWELTEPTERDAMLPHLNKTEVAKIAEDTLPSEFLVCVSGRPKWVMREVA